MATYYNPLNAELTQEQQETNATWIYAYFAARGWSLNAICGMLGNFEAECTINPNVFEGYRAHDNELGNYGYGLPQWTPWLGKTTNTIDEQRNYHGTNNPTYGRWCIDNNKEKSLMESQCEYLSYGLGGYKKDDRFPEYWLPWEEFKKSTESPDFLAKVFYLCYERSASDSFGARPTYAEEWYAFFTGKPTPPDPDPGGGGGEARKLAVWLLFQFSPWR